MIRLRQMQDSDVEDVTRLFEAADPFAKPSLIKKWTKQDLRETPEYCYVAEYRGKIVGAITGYTEGQIGYVENLAVDIKYRESGVGSKLLTKEVEKLKKRGAKKVKLEVHFECASAIPFYYKHGFKMLRCKQNYFGKGEDAIILFKVLCNH
jgi:ribosomal protein S18 acetylase RimI-like enzyme